MVVGGDDPTVKQGRSALPASPALAGGDAQPVATLVRGTVVRRYVIDGVLGAGAMGTVYAAHDRELDRKVALKLLRHPMQGGSHGQRLVREAKLLARLSHPHVVAIYDAGSHAGMVYLVMELVDGHTLRQWLAERPRAWREVLEMFRPAGEGLAAAHAAGIIHRDFKPDNVLVDRQGRVRVGDFGVARLHDVEGDEERGPVAGSGGEVTTGRAEGALTASGAIIGTPAYMAPEQWDPSAQVDARTDQFSFCIALYEAIYGQRPFAGENVAELAHNIGRGELQPVPRDRGEPAWLRRAVVRGLARRPEERHPSMRALLAALTPDAARRRRRWIAAAAAATVAALAVGVVVRRGGQGGELCRGASAQMATVWNPATRSAIEAAFRATGSPLAVGTTTLAHRALDQRAREWIDLRTATCEAIHVRDERPEEELDLAMGCFDHRLAELRALSATLAAAGDAAVVARAVQAVHALPPVKTCADPAALSAGVAPPEPRDSTAVAALRDRHAVLSAQYLTGAYRDAIEPARALAADARRLGYRPVEAEAYLLLGRLQHALGEPAAAEQTLSDAIAASQASRAAEVEMASWLELLKLLTLGQERFDDARRLGRVARAAVARAPDPGRFEAQLDDWEGTLLIQENLDRDAARPFLQRALAANERMYGRETLESVGPLRNLADLANHRGEHEEALRLYHQARAIAEKALGADHPIAFVKLTGEGVAHMELNQPEQALGTFRRGLELAERFHGPQTREAARYLNAIGLLQRERGQYVESREFLERSLAAYEKLHGKDHPQIAVSLANLTTVLRPLGKSREALPLLERALSIAEAGGPARHMDVAGILMNQGETYLYLRDWTRARQVAERGLRIVNAAKMPEPYLIGWGDFIVARALYQTGQRERAVELAQRAGRTLDQMHDEDLGPKVRKWLAARSTPARGR